MGKKNYNQIPRTILAEVDGIENRFIKIGYVQQLAKSDIENGKYNYLSIRSNKGIVEYDGSVLPPGQSGRYSKYNIYGRTVTRRDLPKVKKTFSREIYPYGNTNASTVTAYITKEVYQKEITLPEYVKIGIELLSETNEFFEFSFELSEILDKTASYFEKQLLAYINLMQENLGGFCVYSENKTPKEEIIRNFYVDWELLPPDSINVEYISKNFPKKDKVEQGVALDRNEFIKSLKPIKMFRGRNSFNYYFGAVFKNNIVILENINMGNALYIFYSNWEDLTKLSRTELIHMQSEHVDRVQHNGQWKELVKYLITNHTDHTECN